MFLRIRNMCAILAVLLLVSWAARAGDLAETSRAVSDKVQKAVVGVRLVMKMKMGPMGEREEKMKSWAPSSTPRA